MEELVLQQPELIGRDEELSKLKKSLDMAINGKGSTVYIAGEAGIGKTRLVTELKKDAEAKEVNIIQGWCLAESLEPMMPIKTALREAGMFHLVSGTPPPKVMSAYLVNGAGMLISKAEREESGLDPDIFASMLQAVGNFVHDSLTMMDSNSGAYLNSLGYGEYTILLQSSASISMATVIKGTNSEFLIDDMKRVLVEIGTKYDDWSGDVSKTTDAQPKTSWFIDSGKYDGRFLVDDAKIKQENLFDNILLGLQRASMEKPVLLFLDDLQWSDPTTLNLVHYLARNTRNNNVLILGTYRPEDIVEGPDGSTHHLETSMQGMSREGLFEKIELKRLDAENTEKIVESMLGQTSFEQSFFDKIYKETDGSPFFILEVVKLIIEDEAIKQNEEGIWLLDKELDELDVPSKIYDVVKRRLNRLMKEQKEILECASVIGDEFKSDIVGSILGLNKIRLLKNLSEIEKTHQLIHYLQDKYRFDHAKVKEVLYNGIGEELRKEYHKIVGDTIAELHNDSLDEVVNDLAYHYLEAGDLKAEKYLIMAGDKAKDKYANEEAIRFYEHATELIDDEEELKAIFKNLGDIYNLIGDFENAIKNYTSALEIERENSRKAELHMSLSFVYERKGDYERAREECNNGLKLVGEQDSLELAKLQIFLAGTYARSGDFDKAIENSSEGLAFAEKAGAMMEIAKARQVIGVVHIFKGDLKSALEHLEICLKILKENRDVTAISTIVNNIGLVYRDLGKLEKAREFIEQGLEASEKIGNKYDISSTLNNLGLIYREMGDLARALELFEKGLEISEMIGDRFGAGLRLYNIGEVHLYLGEPQKSLECLNEALAIFIETGNKRSIIECQCNLAYAYLEIGNTVKAFENAEKAVSSSHEIGAKGLEIMGRLSFGTTYIKMNELEKAKSEFDKTQELLAEVGDRILQAGLYYQYARLYICTGDYDKAKEKLVKALSMFEEMGMKLWEEKCMKALAELDVA
ncbi:MAG: tetratricopeptide repeat protein [Thermoplasmata archaeon]|nr:tetratricopeptide repeat protein [Thermoplasmata archaeon]